jgi:hypothetical protein
MAVWLLSALLAAAPSVCSVASEAPVPMFAGIESVEATLTCIEDQVTYTSAAHIVRVALDTPELEFVVSDGEPDKLPLELPTQFLKRTGSRIAFNANLFTVCCYYAAPPKITDLRGFALSGGRVLAPVGNNPKPRQDFPFDTSLAADHGKLAILKSDQVGATAAIAITGSHMLVEGGANVAPTRPDSGEFFGRNSRTIVGLSKDGSTMWIAAVDVGTASAGVKLPEGAQLMIKLGADSAINLDGGGSTSLAFDDNGKPGLLNYPNDGGKGNGCDFYWPAGQTLKCERYVGISFGIRAPALNGVLTDPRAKPEK